MDFDLVQEHFKIAERLEILLKKGSNITKKEIESVDKGLKRLKEIEKLLKTNKMKRHRNDSSTATRRTI